MVVIRIGGRVEGFVGTDAGVRADPEQAAVLLERAARAELAPDAPTHRPFLDRMLRQVRPLCRRRLDAVEATRWRAADRDRLSRRLIPWVLSAARRAAVQRRPADLRRLDELVPIHQRTGLVTFYGPMATSFYKTSYSYHYWTGRAGGGSCLRARLVVLVLEQELLEIQVALNPAHHGIVDRAAIAEPQELAPLDS